MLKKILSFLVAAAITFGPVTLPASAQQTVASYVAGARIAANYAYGFGANPGANHRNRDANHDGLPGGTSAGRWSGHQPV